MRVLGDQIAEEAAHLDAAVHRLLTHVREFDAGNGWFDAGAQSCAHWLSWRVGWTLGTGREHVRVARRLAELPRIDDALRQGKLSYAKVRAITRAASAATEEALLVDALASTAAQLETICRKFRAVQRLSRKEQREIDEDRHVRRRDLDNGLVRIEATLRPEEAAIVMAAIEQQAKALAAARQVEPTAAQTTGVAAVAQTTGVTAAAQTTSVTAAQTTGVTSVTAAVQTPSATAAAQTTGVAAAAQTTGLTAVPQAPDATTATVAQRPARAAVEDRSAKVSAGTRRPRFDRADALVAIAQSLLRGEKLECSPIEVVMTVQRAALVKHDKQCAVSDGVDSVSVFADGTCVSAETARRLTCDCGVVELVEDEHGQPLSVGRRTRTMTASLKRALLHRDTTCRFPGCTNRVFLEGHHVKHWANGGETSLENACLLCARHHTFVHELGYRIHVIDGDFAFFDPRGRRVTQEGPRIAPSSVEAWERIRAENDDLGITPSTSQCRWDGQPVQYDLVVGGLARLDGLRGPANRAIAPPLNA